MDDAAALDALIVAAPDDLPIADKNRTDRDAAFIETGAGFLNCALQKWIDAENVARCRS